MKDHASKPRRHHRQDAPLTSADSARELVRELARDGVDRLSLCAAVSLPDVLPALIDETAQAQMSLRRLRVGVGGLAGIAPMLEALSQHFTPHDRAFLRFAPLKTLHLDLDLRQCTAAETLDAVQSALPALSQLKTGYYTEISARLTFDEVAPSAVLSLLRALTPLTSRITLHFAPDTPTAQTLDKLRSDLCVVMADPVARHPALRITGLPFCLLPPSEFRPLLRASLDALPSHARLYYQAAALADLAEVPRPADGACATCRRHAACHANAPLAKRPDLAAAWTPAPQSTLAFAGASLTPDDLKAHDAPDLIFTTPAAQGDIFLALMDGFDAVLLLDGYFFQRYALTTFEVLVGLLHGAAIFGAGSLGAIRALELANYGMQRHGYVYDTLRAEPIVPYHAVAQTYDPQDRPLSTPLVSVMYFLDQAVAQGLLSPAQRHAFLASAQELHFSELSFRRLFRHWRKATLPNPPDPDALEAFYAGRPPEGWDVKRKDALALLQRFRSIAAQTDSATRANTAQNACTQALATLRAQYNDTPDSSLPEDWQKPQRPGATARENDLSVALDNLQRFFAPLAPVVADTSFLDKTDYAMVNAVFVPFYHLEYGNSAGSGYGESLDAARVAAFGEVVERIPCGTLRTAFAPPEALSAPPVNFLDLPFYQDMDGTTLAHFTDRQPDGTNALCDPDYVLATELISGRKCALPKHGARLPNSCGMAAGNTLLETVVYGLYELIEHDVNACYETLGLMQELRHLNLSPDLIKDPAVHSLMDDLRGRGHGIHFFNLINIYGLPTVLSVFHDADRQLLFTGQCARCDLGAAMAHAFHEALNGHFVSYFGSRDDRQGFEQKSSAPARHLLDMVLGPPMAAPLTTMSAASNGDLATQCATLLDRLNAAGVETIYALDLSPKPEFGIAVSKVIAPGLSFRSAARRAGAFFDKCHQTHRLVADATGQTPPEAPFDTATYARPLHRFFKA